MIATTQQTTDRDLAAVAVLARPPTAGQRTPVQQFYRDQTVLITGGSGFMGKVLVEKLLYACPDLTAIYLLMRPKRGKIADQRLDEMFKLPVSTQHSDIIIVTCCM